MSVAHSRAESIAAQRESLKDLLRDPLSVVAQAAAPAWHNASTLDETFTRLIGLIPACKFLYALDTHAQQLSSTITPEGAITADLGRDRSSRPYMNERVPSEGFLLSHAYISLRAKRPSLTAIQIVRGSDNRVLGFVGADFDLRDLPLTAQLYEEPVAWRQIKGDPAIRGGVFMQSRSDSQLDTHIDTILGVVEELMTERGVFHVILHFSSSRAIIWLHDDPYRYRLLDVEALTDPDTCLAYPRRPYPSDALILRERIRAVLDGLRELRFIDETFYLRSGTLNIFNGVVGLTFSCDGSHYLPWQEFLVKGPAFWLGASQNGGECSL